MLGRAYRPVRFVASTRAKIDPYLELNPTLEFKLDVEKDWDRALMERLAATDRVRVLDLKAYYRGTAVDLEPDPELYRAVVEAFPDVVIEDRVARGRLPRGAGRRRGAAELRRADPLVERRRQAAARAALAQHQAVALRDARASSLECIEECEEHGIRMYGGGQFELGPGRRQIQRLASLFYADGPNDVAPSEYNDGPARDGSPDEPAPPPEGVGF